jgi:hypothetical protein
MRSVHVVLAPVPVSMSLRQVLQQPLGSVRASYVGEAKRQEKLTQQAVVAVLGVSARVCIACLLCWSFCACESVAASSLLISGCWAA